MTGICEASAEVLNIKAICIFPSPPSEEEKTKHRIQVKPTQTICSVSPVLVALAPPLLPQLHVVGWEEPISALAHPTPPAIVNHFYVGDDVIGVKGDLIIAS